MSGEPKTLWEMTPREAWEHAWEQAIGACRHFEDEAAAKRLEAVRSIGRQLLDQEPEPVPVVARDEAAELRAAAIEWWQAMRDYRYVPTADQEAQNQRLLAAENRLAGAVKDLAATGGGEA